MATTSASLLHLPSPSFFPVSLPKTVIPFPLLLRLTTYILILSTIALFPPFLRANSPSPSDEYVWQMGFQFSDCKVRIQTQHQQRAYAASVQFTGSTKVLQLEDLRLDIHKEGKCLIHAVQKLVSGDQCEGRFVFCRDNKKPKDKNKQVAERDAAVEALAWLTHTTDNGRDEDDKSPPDVTDNMLKLLGKHRSIAQ
ncbi:hypothetical protein FEM48_Zijuj03G0028600 [Ziziphus jujuba var. spinosa]|uniref:Uncharacterized protein n=1 Tax=Ziziphus jujuba var. spinosa TaxID=714518 RepID=A0A978VMR1_ZIZJJ|nr:hypothetical protein FEM48_Zijuj03G0028600 [Ziziphus jujuba var. spinosa]